MLFFIQLILNVAVLYPYDATHPYDGQSFSWDECKPATAVMSATFYEEVESFDVSKVHISPENWYSLSGVCEVLSNGFADKTVKFSANAWDYCLTYNTFYTVTFDEGAVVFKNKAAENGVQTLAAGELFSPAFSYSFTTGQLPTGVDALQAETPISFKNKEVIAAGKIEVYNLAGVLVSEGVDSVSLAGKAQGIYIVRCGNNVMKIVLR